MSDKSDQCPHCAEILAIGAIICRFCDRGVSKNHFKNCPQCSEMIWNGATYCRYCKSSVPGPDNGAGWFQTALSGPQKRLDDNAIEKIFQRIIRRPE